jgi:hypothetical protein
MLAWEQNPRITVLGLRRIMLSFETAIEHVESHYRLPDVYGIYAVNNGELHELEALAGRVPDPRVFMSTPVKGAVDTALFGVLDAGCGHTGATPIIESGIQPGHANDALVRPGNLGRSS